METDFRIYLHRVARHIFGMPLRVHQVVSPETFAGKLRSADEKHGLLFVIGIVNAGTIASLGLLTFVHREFAALLADIAMGTEVVIVVSF